METRFFAPATRVPAEDNPIVAARSRNRAPMLTVPHARHYSHAPFVGGSPSMDRQHRRELKHDKFVDELGTLSSRARENQRVLVTITAVAVAVAVIAYGIFFYRSNREKKAQDEL